MASDQIRQMWGKFDDLIGKAESPETKLLIEAIKVQTELMNIRLALIESNTAAAVRASSNLRQSGYK
jgi:hypothetical protein